MDRYCEFCVNLRSVVYCKADAAYLCLSCDTKVHSANPLSNRHHRTLICESCRCRPTYVRCYDHHKFMCRGCDLSQHDANSSQHRKRVMKSYVGSPSAQDLGILWGFDLNQFLDGSAILNNNTRFGSNSSAYANTSIDGLETGNLGQIDEHIKEVCGGIQAFVVLQQLIDLLKVQTTDIDHNLSVIRYQQEHKLETYVNQFSQQFLLGGGRPHHHEIGLDPCSSPFTQLDHLESSEAEETNLQGDSFWQCKSPVPSSQLWSQNMQDLGVCEEPSCLDDLNIPDIDLTFRNFEELFRTDQDPTSDVEQYTSTTTSFTIAESSSKKARYASQIMSFSQCAESSGTMCIDSGISPSSGSTEHHESAKSKRKKNVEMKESKQGQCGYRKARSYTRKRTRSQGWKFKSHESGTKSC